MKKEKLINSIISFFEEKEWKYVYDNDSKITSSINMGNVIGRLRLIIDVRKEFYKVCVILNSRAVPENYPLVAEYLHRANYGLNLGNFEFDYDDGEIRYKSTTEYNGVDLSKGVIEKSIIVPIAMFLTYGNNLIRLLTGSGDPQELIAEAERDEEDS